MAETAARPEARRLARQRPPRGMLTGAAIIAPPVVVVSFVLRSGTRSWLDDAVLLATGILLPCLAFHARIPDHPLDGVLLAISCSTSIYLLGRLGLVAGISVSLATFSVLALIWPAAGPATRSSRSPPSPTTRWASWPRTTS